MSHLSCITDQTHLQPDSVIAVPGEVVMKNLGTDGWINILLRSPNKDAYAVCAINERRSVARCPNYSSGDSAQFFAALTFGGITEILDWTDRAAALRRYALLAGTDETATLGSNIRSIFRAHQSFAEPLCA